MPLNYLYLSMLVFLVLLACAVAEDAITLDDNICDASDEMSQLQVDVSQLKVNEKQKAIPSKPLNTDRLYQSESNTSDIDLDVDPTCLINTGGTCAVQECSRNRGPVSCESLFRCVCDKGSCSGADGRCYKGEYKVILDNFKIENFRWKGSYLYASRFLDMVGTSKSVNSQSYFRLIETGDGSWIIYSKKYPDYAIAVTRSSQTNTHPITIHSSEYYHSTQTFRASQNNVQGAGYGVGFRPSVKKLALTLGAPPGGYGYRPDPEARAFNGSRPVMLRSFEYGMRAIYSPAFHPFVEVYYGDPGDGGLWLFDPPLPVEFDSTLARYHGPRCRFNCYGDWYGGGVFNLGIVAVIIVAIGCACAIGVAVASGSSYIT